MKKLKFTTGSGWYFIPQIGKFIIKTNNSEFEFTDRHDAIIFWNKLNEPKAFWDLTNEIPELRSVYDY